MGTKISHTVYIQGIPDPPSNLLGDGGWGAGCVMTPHVRKGRLIY